MDYILVSNPVFSNLGASLKPHLALGMSMGETAKLESKFILQKHFYWLYLSDRLVFELQAV